jgi:hypothetical protein
MKTCVCCGDSSDEVEWLRHKTGTPMGNKCHPCLRIYRTATVHLLEGYRDRRRLLRLARRERAYNVVYEDQLVLQTGCCAGCGRAFDELLCFDHNHRSGQFRGLLCDRCNKALGLVDDDPEILRSLAVYVEMNGWEQIAHAS